MSVHPGHPAPDFRMSASQGRTVSLATQRGRPFVLYFYPRADTPGCTRQACGFQEALGELAAIGTEIIGVSKDTLPAIEAFARKHHLTFPLAADTTGVAEAYGVWVEKSMYGRTYMGIERASFLIDRNGVVARVWRTVRVPGHAADVMAAARAL